MSESASPPPHVSRRQILRAAAVVGVASCAGGRSLLGDEPATRPAGPPKPYYYVDGYHGGIDGHMPPASLGNVLDGLDRIASWKVSFEIEPYSWAAFAKSDPDSIKRLAQFLTDKTPAARVELVSGAYGQTYAWNISGESNIRHLVYGVRAIQSVFPGVNVDTYAVQEPCWTNCLPQLLKSLGYKRAVLKNSTCWGGYHGPTLDADLIHWTSPDGTGIPAVPRYALEGLVPPATLESSQPSPNFIERCTLAGIANPAGAILQDMGWPGRPWRLGIAPRIAGSMKHVTWREYVDTIAVPPTQTWHASQEDLRVGLAWGASILQHIAQGVRESENLILQAEKLAVLANHLHGSEYPSALLDRAWIDLMFSQHHDVWIVPYNRHPGGSWAAEVEDRLTRSRQACRRVIESSAGSNAAATRAASSRLRVWNTTGFPRRDLAAIPLPDSTDRWTLRDSKGIARRTQTCTDPQGNTTLLADVEVPALGYTTFRLEKSDREAEQPDPAPVSARVEPDGATLLQNELYSLRLDPRRGGRISSLVLKSANRQFVDPDSPRAFHEFRGYFGGESRFLSSADAPAIFTVEESGPLRATVRIDGHIGPHPFRSRISVTSGSSRIDFQTTFDFPVDAPPFTRPTRAQTFRVGEPWPRGQDVTRSDRRPVYDSSYKLQALFPAALKSPKLDKNAPFAVCRSALTDTTFNSWATLRHNIVLNWVDLLDEDGSAGLALFTDHTTAYHLAPAEPLGLVCCYAGPGTWFDYALGRKPTLNYGLIPHEGNWQKALLWQELARGSEPLITARDAPSTDPSFSFAQSLNPHVHLASLYQDQGNLLLRLFNASASPADAAIELSTSIKTARLVELDGRLMSELSFRASDGNRHQISLTVPAFAIRTVRLSRE